MRHRQTRPHTPPQTLTMTNPYEQVQAKLTEVDIEALKNDLSHVAAETPSAEQVLAMKLLRGDITVESVSYLWYKFQKRVSFWYLVLLIVAIECLMSENLTNACTVCLYLHNFVYMNWMLVPDSLDQALISSFTGILLSSLNIYTLLKDKNLINATIAAYGATLSPQEVSDAGDKLSVLRALIIIRVLNLVILLLESTMLFVIESSNRRRFPVYFIFNEMAEKQGKLTKKLPVTPFSGNSSDLDEKTIIDAPPRYNDIQGNAQNCYETVEKRTDGLDPDTLA